MTPHLDLRPLLPLAVGSASVAFPWVEPGEAAVMLGTAILTAVVVLVLELRAPAQAWKRRWSLLSFRGVHRFPRDERGVEALARLCTAVSAVRGELGSVDRRRRRSLRQRLDRLVALGADLCVARESLAGVSDPETHRRLDRQIDELVPTAMQLRATLLRTGASRAARPDEMHELRLEERELRAAVGSKEEMREVERWTRYAS